VGHADGRLSWDALLGEMVAAAARLTRAAPDAFPSSTPRPGANDADIAAAAARIGRPLDAQHEALLRHADGWTSAFLGGDVLSTRQLGAGRLWTDAQASLDTFYAEGDPRGWPPRTELVPLHASSHDIDVMALWLGGPTTDGGHPVLWFAGELVGRWPDVRAWWRQMLVVQGQSLAHVHALTGGAPS
jgi:hypothetical protein